ncbi:MAG TPA: HEAT repeat domain-containing protein, partial [Planctomycetota bacterium]|nr:HEAT repeat domain-containing protein [Planctomycetota bacterium]
MIGLTLVALSLAVAAQETPDDPFAPHVAAASKEGEQSIARFKVPAGWKVELVAAEPLLANPVCFALDHDGKTIYVGETFRHHKGVTDIRDHMDWNDDDLAARTVEDRVAYFKRQLGEKFSDFERACERVRRLTDTNADGVFDKATVFSDRFHEAADGIGASLLSYRGDVFYTCIPSLWKLRDDDGDGRADVEKELSTGYGVHVALLGHDLHGLRIGPDGLLYFSIGDRGFNVPLPDGKRLEYPEAGAVLRCNLDGSGLEVFATGLRNPQDLIFDAYGNLFTGDNNSDGGDKARLVHVVEGSDSGWRQAYQWLTEPNLRGPWNDEKQWQPYPENQVAAILPPIANLCDGPSGITIDFGTGLPPQYAGWLFLADFRGTASNSGVRGFELVPNGAGFKLGKHDETWWGVLATDVEVGTDGAMYVLDWTEGWNQTGKGRIYRAYDPATRDSSAAQKTKRLLAGNFDALSEVELIACLSDADQRVRQEAQFALVRRGEPSRASLERIASTASAPQLARVHAIWGLGMLLRRPAAPGFARLVALLEDADAEIRAQAARALGDARSKPAESSLAQHLSDASPRVRMFAAIGLARIGMKARAKELVAFAAANEPVDPVLRHCASLAMSACMHGGELITLATHESLQVRLAAVVALRRQGSVGVGRFLNDVDPRVADEAERAIYDAPIPLALGALADSHRLTRRSINALFRLGDFARVCASVLDPRCSDELRIEALDLLAKWSVPPKRDPVVGAWRPIDKSDSRDPKQVLLAIGNADWISSKPDVAKAWIRACVANDLPDAAKRFAAWCGDDDTDGSVRARALEGLIALESASGTNAVRAAIASESEELRAAAIAQLPKIDAAQALELADSVLRNGSLIERRAALRTLNEVSDAGAAKLLAQIVDQQTAGKLDPELALDVALAAEKSRDALVAEKLAALRASRMADKWMGEYADSLHGGDAKAGRKVFREKSELACLRCHKIEDKEGGEVGPDLVGVGKRLDRRALLESLVEP